MFGSIQRSHDRRTYDELITKPLNTVPQGIHQARLFLFSNIIDGGKINGSQHHQLTEITETD